MSLKSARAGLTESFTVLQILTVPSRGRLPSEFVMVMLWAKASNTHKRHNEHKEALMTRRRDYDVHDHTQIFTSKWSVAYTASLSDEV